MEKWLWIDAISQEAEEHYGELTPDRDAKSLGALTLGLVVLYCNEAPLAHASITPVSSVLKHECFDRI